MRTYGDGCSSAHALDLVGERWALLIVRDLLFGPKRFSDLAAGLPQASPNVLTQRLRELEAAGIVRRRRLPPPASTMVYELTEWGAELEPILMGLQRWGAASPTFPHDVPVGCDAAMLALKNAFDASAVARPPGARRDPLRHRGVRRHRRRPPPRHPARDSRTPGGGHRDRADDARAGRLRDAIAR